MSVYERGMSAASYNATLAAARSAVQNKAVCLN